MHLYYSPVRRHAKYAAGAVVVVGMITIVVAATMSVMALRLLLQSGKRLGPFWGGVCAGLINGVLISQMNKVKGG